MFLLCSRTVEYQCSFCDIQATVQLQQNFTLRPVYTQYTFINMNMFEICDSHGAEYCDMI